MGYDMIKFIQTNFEYRDGFLYRSTCLGGEAIGKRAGWLTVCNKNPYWKISINKKTMLLHQVIFMFHHGFLPKCIDHIDGNSTNNLIENLRPSTQSQNIANSKLRKNNTTGFKGVSFRKDSNKWTAQIMVNGKHISLGSHATKKLAFEAYVIGSKKYFGEFARAEGKVTL